jgi:hypothetical protein
MMIMIHELPVTVNTNIVACDSPSNRGTVGEVTSNVYIFHREREREDRRGEREREREEKRREKIEERRERREERREREETREKRERREDREKRRGERQGVGSAVVGEM